MRGGRCQKRTPREREECGERYRVWNMIQAMWVIRRPNQGRVLRQERTRSVGFFEESQMVFDHGSFKCTTML